MVPLVGKLSQNADNVIADEMGVGIPGENLSSGQDMPIEILPGTEIMIESGNIRSKKIPQPSNDPCDPLNWKKRWKISTITTVTYITFTQGFAPLAIAPMMGDLMEAFGCTLADAVEFSGICILVLAFSNFIWVPMSNAYGRRPVLLLSTLIVLASAVWRAKANSYNSFLWACIVDGIGAGPAETIQPAVTAEIFFLESLGKWNTLYWVAYTSSLMMGPIISGSISKHAGWRAFWWLNAALLALGFLMVLFLFPETMYQRPARGNLSRSSTITRSTKRPLEMVDEQNMVMNTLREESSTTQLRPSNSPQNDRWLGMGYPSSEQWKLYQSRSRTWNGIFADLWLPWKLLAFPIIEFGSFVVSFSCSTFLIANLTQDQVFRAAPYHFDSNMIGLTNFAIFFGALLGLYSVGWLGDRVVDRLTARNSNVREPEMRLLAGIPFIFVMILSHIIIAAGYVWHWHWSIIVIIGYGAAGIQVAALPSIASTYVGDCYKPITNSAFVAMTVNKNVWAYGFSKFITPWSEKSGFIPPLMTHMALTTAWCGFGVIFYYFGKTFRRWTKDSKVHWY